MPEFQLKTPVAFIIFNRPDTTERVFAEIAKAKPPKLLVVGDGARANHAGEANKVAATRAIINRVDWDCEVLTNYSEINLGCKRRVSSGIDWVFEQVEEAIILEDDCLPDPTFFRFCQELLERYRCDDRVMMISGTNLASTEKLHDSYYFSRYPHIWGWASWRRMWHQYDVRMELLPQLLRDESFRHSFRTDQEYKHWVRGLGAVYSGAVDTWDAQVMFMAFRTSGLSIFPKNNLVSNIGFRPDATHTTREGGDLDNLPTIPLDYPLRHPTFVYPNLLAESERKRKEGIGVPKLYKIAKYIMKRVGVV